ncbi:MAG TPA: NUDIX domain-containing protein [Candidatus Saccharimonadales bacterium]|nr:NUDIX domain-containing protein [Candidatus Saccharimonadales bacterium]
MRTAARAIIDKDGQLLVMHRNKFGQEYYALIGGGVDFGEAPEQALLREIHEEASLTIANPRLVIIEDAGPIYGRQYIYTCDYVSGEPQLSPDSDEAKISAAGQNTYEPRWLPVDALATTNLLPVELKEALVDGLANGWPEQPIELTIRS